MYNKSYRRVIENITKITYQGLATLMKIFRGGERQRLDDPNQGIVRIANLDELRKTFPSLAEPSRAKRRNGKEGGL